MGTKRKVGCLIGLLSGLQCRVSSDLHGLAQGNAQGTPTTRKLLLLAVGCPSGKTQQTYCLLSSFD